MEVVDLRIYIDESFNCAIIGKMGHSILSTVNDFRWTEIWIK